MSDLLQPGQHPDADLLNAFVENALPLHERQRTLAHLAICSACREIVYLAHHSDLGEFAAPQATATHKPWFSGWKLAWPVAAALACGVIFAIHLHNIRISINKTVIITTAAIRETAPTVPTPSLPAIPHLPPPDQPKVAPKRAPNSWPIVTPPVAVGAVTETATGSINATLQPQSATAFSLQDHNTPFLPQAGSVPATGSIHRSAFRSTNEGGVAVTKAIAGPLSSSFGGPVLHAGPPNADALDRSQQKAVSSTTPQSNQIDFSAKRTFNRQYQTPPPLSAFSIAVAGSSQTVAVNGALTTVDAAASYESPTEKLPSTLPSRLPVLSMVSSARQTLAIDTNGTLFLSQDRGISWQSIPAQWTGRAQKLRLVLSPSQTVAKDNGSSLAPNTGAMIMGSISQTQPSVFELSIDTGVIWTSTDGQTWKQK